MSECHSWSQVSPGTIFANSSAFSWTEFWGVVCHISSCPVSFVEESSAWLQSVLLLCCVSGVLIFPVFMPQGRYPRTGLRGEHWQLSCRSKVATAESPQLFLTNVHIYWLNFHSEEKPIKDSKKRIQIKFYFSSGLRINNINFWVDEKEGEIFYSWSPHTLIQKPKGGYRRSLFPVLTYAYHWGNHLWSNTNYEWRGTVYTRILIISGIAVAWEFACKSKSFLLLSVSPTSHPLQRKSTCQVIP